jgi:hypothetical protein
MRQLDAGLGRVFEIEMALEWFVVCAATITVIPWHLSKTGCIGAEKQR